MDGHARMPLNLQTPHHTRFPTRTSLFSLKLQINENPCHLHKKGNERGQLSVLLIMVWYLYDFSSMSLLVNNKSRNLPHCMLNEYSTGFRRML